MAEGKSHGRAIMAQEDCCYRSDITRALVSTTGEFATA